MVEGARSGMGRGGREAVAALAGGRGKERADRVVHVRAVAAADLPKVVALDERNTGTAKPAYWADLLRRYTRRGQPRFFLVAERNGRFVGFIIGEVRAWEFGSPPCGWVFAIGVEPEMRVSSVGSRLMETVCERFKAAGVEKVRTMLARDDKLVMSFFRSQGMMAGPFIQLEKTLD
jgi:ribosomal protein S18 acetylase RimI-like enzyme